MRRLHVIIGITALAGVLALVTGNYFISINSDLAAKGTIAASVVTVLGVIFSAVYKEISSYYNERNQNISKKWDLIFPFIKSYYNPWIGASNSWLNSLETVNVQNDVSVTRVLFLTTLFFGIRRRFLEEGGLLLLSSTEEEEKVSEAYEEIKKNYQWAEIETPLRVSNLQKYYLDKKKENEALIFDTFAEEVNNNQDLKNSKDLLKKWLSDQKNVDALKEKVKSFSTTFKHSIDRLYTAWSD